MGVLSLYHVLNKQRGMVESIKAGINPFINTIIRNRDILVADHIRIGLFLL